MESQNGVSWIVNQKGGFGTAEPEPRIQNLEFSHEAKTMAAGSGFRTPLQNQEARTTNSEPWP